jgi:hypothetical protein
MSPEMRDTIAMATMVGIRRKRLELLPIWRLAFPMSLIRSSKAERARQGLRLDLASRGERPGSASRNTWIAEAIMEKLTAEEDNAPSKRGRRRDA